VRTVDVLSERDTTRLRTNVTMRTAVVAAVTGSTLTITLAGADVSDVPHLASYAAPAIGHTVVCLQTSGQLLVIGKVA
jgi:hypothetical protein